MLATLKPAIEAVAATAAGVNSGAVPHRAHNLSVGHSVMTDTLPCSRGQCSVPLTGAQRHGRDTS